MEPSYVNEPEYEYPAYVCFDCGHVWVPEDGTFEPDENDPGWLWSPDDTTCPACGSDDTDEK